MKADDLTSDQKRQLLEILEKKMGYSDYQDAVNQAGGKDEFLNHFFAQIESSQTSQRAEAKKEFDWSSCLALLGVFVVMGIISLIAGAIWGSEVGGNVFSTLFYLLMFGGYIIAIIEWIFKNFGIVITIGLAGGALYLLIKLLVWTWSGTVDWFGWLFGHF